MSEAADLERLADPDLRFLSGGGAMGARMRSHDWTDTPLGPPGQWPQSLRSSVSTCLNCSFPILLWWGRDLVKLYNDAYRPILGDKHPAALGRPGREVWPEIWDTIGPMLAGVTEQGEAAPADDLLLLLHRHGYTEECYFSFSYSPIHDESGGVGGVFCPVLETTPKVIGARRLRTISDLGATERAESANAAADACAQVMAANPADLPFALIYLIDRDASRAHLAGAAGLAPGAAEAPAEIALGPAFEHAWPIHEAAAGALHLTDLARRWPGLPPGIWNAVPEEAFLQPITPPGASDAAAVLVAGVSPRKRLDGDYRSFLSLVASQIGNRIAAAVALAAERRRAEALADIDRAKTAFFSNISHEFRTPLTLMLGPLEEILGKPALPVSEARSLIDTAHRNGLRLLRLVNALLEFSRVEAGRAQLSREPTDLAALTKELASNFRSLCERAGLILVVDCPALPAPVSVDRRMWESIILNLLSNAFKFTLAGMIGISLRVDGKSAVLTVRDTGMGVSSTDLPHLFERFYRAEGAKGRSHEGSGIGLSLVRDLVRLHDGTVAVESELGAGSAFIVRIPYVSDPAAVVSAPALREIGRQTEAFVEEAARWLPRDPTVGDRECPQTSSPAGHVLLADDNADMREYVQRLLTGEGYVVEAVPDGFAALAAARAVVPDLILSDIMMPGLDGLQLVQALRAEPALLDVPVLLMTARAGEDARIEGLESGADDYLTKPFSAAELVGRVNANLRLGRARRGATASMRLELERLVAARTEERDQVWRNARDILVVASQEGTIRDVNPAWQTVLGNQAQELIGRRIQDLGCSFSAEPAPCRHLDGSTRWIVWHVKHENGVIYAYGRDVTSERETAEALARTEEALRQSQKMEAVGQLTGGIAHDFNNLLTGIIGSLELLRMRVAQGRTGDLDRYLSAAFGAAKRAGALTHRLLAFARRQTLDPRPTDLNRLITDMEELICRTIGPSIALEVGRHPEAWVTMVDPNQLESALLNLCINARDAMPGGGRLVVATANCRVDRSEARERDMQAGDYVALQVSDTGTGMPADVIARAFDPFFTTKPVGRGTGLGLSMVHGFARQSGGDAAIRSEPGQGTTVSLLLPRCEAEAEGVDRPRDITALARLDGTRTILLVDDEPTVRGLVAEALNDMGCHVLQAEDGAGGLNVVQGRARIDLLVTDVGLPGGLNGRQLADAARVSRPGLKVLFITGYAETAVLQRGTLEEGMAVLVKPFAINDLAARVRSMVGAD